MCGTPTCPWAGRWRCGRGCCCHSGADERASEVSGGASRDDDYNVPSLCNSLKIVLHTSDTKNMHFLLCCAEPLIAWGVPLSATTLAPGARRRWAWPTAACQVTQNKNAVELGQLTRGCASTCSFPGQCSQTHLLAHDKGALQQRQQHQSSVKARGALPVALILGGEGVLQHPLLQRHNDAAIQRKGQRKGGAGPEGPSGCREPNQENERTPAAQPPRENVATTSRTLCGQQGRGRPWSRTRQ